MNPQQELRKKLSEGLAAWLTFEKTSGREGLFSEKYLALPISQILASHFGQNVQGEHKHPILSMQGRKGRPPQIDFVVQNDGTTTLALESKWIGATKVKVTEVVWDCVRLELAANHYKCDALFVLAGKKGSIEKTLESSSFNPTTSRGKPALILGLHGVGRMSVNIESPKKDYSSNLHDDYLRDFPEVRFPRSFVCGHGTQVNPSASKNAYVAAVWHIKPEANKRFTFFAK